MRAEGAGLTTVPADFLPVPLGVSITQIDGMPAEIRRVFLVHTRNLDPDLITPLVKAMREAATSLAAQPHGAPR